MKSPCFHHQLVARHPFPNGNSRHARLMADLLIERSGKHRFSWGQRSLSAKYLIDADEIRQRYITALQAADARDMAPLLAFVRS